MTLRINATLVLAGITIAVEANSVEEFAAAHTRLAATLDPKTGGATTPAPTPETKPGKKSASTDKAAATPSPADGTKVDSAASAPTPASPSPAAAPAAEPVVDYLKSGIPEKISGYLGDKESGGYADRRAALVKLLADFKVETAKKLKAEQFKDFGTKLDELLNPAEDLG